MSTGRIILFSDQYSEMIEHNLFGKRIRFRKYWNNAGNYWILDIFEAFEINGIPQERALVLGVVLVGGVNLIRPYNIDIGGQLWLVPFKKSNEMRSIEGWNENFALFHYTDEEIEEIKLEYQQAMNAEQL